jgi:CDP-diacylglycerol--glycerol-3-phosphate 3-phosphatidyltransferase
MTGRTDRSLVTPETRARVRRLGEPIALALGRLGLTPNALTVIGFAITTVAALLAAGQAWAAAGVVMFAGGVFDMLDGALARATGRVSQTGAFMDSVFDRWGEAVFYVGVVAGCAFAAFEQGTWLAAAAMASAFLVSYTRAKSEGLGFTHGTGMAEVGLAPREIRLVVLTVGVTAAGLAGGVSPGGAAVALGLPAGQLWLAGSLGLIAVLATVTVTQRILHVLAQGRQEP